MKERANTNAAKNQQRLASDKSDASLNAVIIELEKSGLTTDDVEASLLNAQQTAVPQHHVSAPTQASAGKNSTSRR